MNKLFTILNKNYYNLSLILNLYKSIRSFLEVKKKYMLFINKILKFFFYVLKLSFEFNVPKKKPILCYHKNTEVILFFGIKKNLIETMNLEKINLYIFFLTVLNFKFSINSYVHNYIKFVSPKVVITFIDNDIRFYSFKFFFPNIVFIAIQNGLRLERDQFWSDLKKEKKNILSVDYYLLFNRYYADELKKYIKHTPILIGSLKNNSVEFKKCKKNLRSLLFISQIDPHNIKKYYYWKTERVILPIINEYCKKRNIEFVVFSRSNHKNEKNFYHSILNKNFKYIERYELDRSFKKNYKIIDNFNNILFIDTTMGYEFITRKKKIIVFSGRDSQFGIKSYFGWPKKLNYEGNFYTCKTDKKKIFNLLDKNLKISYKLWRKKNFKILKDLFVYKKDNNQFVNLVTSILD